MWILMYANCCEPWVLICTYWEANAWAGYGVLQSIGFRMIFIIMLFVFMRNDRCVLYNISDEMIFFVYVFVRFENTCGR